MIQESRLNVSEVARLCPGQEGVTCYGALMATPVSTVKTMIVVLGVLIVACDWDLPMECCMISVQWHSMIAPAVFQRPRHVPGVAAAAVVECNYIN